MKTNPSRQFGLKVLNEVSFKFFLTKKYIQYSVVKVSTATATYSAKAEC